MRKGDLASEVADHNAFPAQALVCLEALGDVKPDKSVMLGIIA
jgi:hypothetical protein